MTPLAMALAFVVAPMTWLISGLLIAAMSSGYVKGKTAIKRLPKNLLIIFFWPVWVIYIIYKK
ncbi:hypothetical protein PP425_gp097 [Enterobacter phage vB_EclM_Q7622]|uniref:hypothetical protein n=1 Tax=Enterobacter phage vB_EclM_Q7622 TaxID=2908628 RepID=UPI00232936EE|nr:hypothetical protein PP425_gp097 [Enterobacter phage vB_EclM_Q7622]UIS65612.1 hypothetical protein Q76222_00097 [Enterobacter phage vB_EclM_Q7622]